MVFRQTDAEVQNMSFVSLSVRMSGYQPGIGVHGRTCRLHR